VRLRDVVEEFVGGRGADDGEHVAPVGISEWNVGVLHV
jgi:hypothetical protein